MAIEDFADPEVAVAIALTAAVASPRARKVMRRGAVLGMAGVLMAGDALGSFARGAGRGMQQGLASAADLAGEARDEGPADERPRAAASRRAARPTKQAAAPAASTDA
ncbi:MAG TPA: hypothetical protein VIJ28_17900 [Chloroflexota bacterium]